MKTQKIIRWTLAGILMAAAFCMAAKETVLAKTDDVKVYQNKVRQLYEKPIYSAKQDEYMEVIESDKDVYKVQLSNGKVGWVDKRFVAPLDKKTKKVANYVFEDANVQGWLDNPQAVYILDMTDPNFKPIKLDKSFADQIEQNVDREKSEEQHGMYRPGSEGKK
ncbi:MAG: SH3 domain-containing protein [Fibrobacterota bacterium]